MSEPVDLFQSFSALQAAHDDLLKWYEQLGSSAEGNAEFWAEVSGYVRRARVTGVLFHPSTDRMERRAMQSILDYWVNMMHRVGQPLPDGRLAPFDVKLAPLLPDHPCPYQGLSAFDEERQEFFFGRDRLVDEMVEKLDGGSRLLILVGASGSGKSSVVRAGLLPALRGGALPGSESWRYVTLVPGADAMGNLDRALRGAGDETARPRPGTATEPMPSVEGTERDPDHSAKGPIEAIEKPIVLIIDQFEELFTLCDDQQAREAFSGRLLGLVDKPHPCHVAILTMRIDFEFSLARLPNLYLHLPAARVDVGALSIDDLRDAIEKPAAKVGLKFETGIIEDLIATILGERAGLPLLQFTLLQLWARRDRNRVTKAVYESVGNPRQALGRSADAFLDELIPEDQSTVKRILLQMVRPGEGSEVTSNRIGLEAVFRRGGAWDRVERVLYRLVCQAQLVKLSGTTTDICGGGFGFDTGRLSALMEEESARGNVVQIEVAHEALARNWPTLEKWLEEERERLTTPRRLEAKAAEWVRMGRGNASLLRGVELLEAERWLVSADAKRLGHGEDVLELVQFSRKANTDARRRRLWLTVGLAALMFLIGVAVGLLLSGMQ